MPRPRRDSVRPKPGRPVKPINWDQVDEFLLSGTPGSEIASFFDMHPITFYDRCVAEKGVNFTDYYALKRPKGQLMLRHHQFKKALGATKLGDTQMLIHLGKHVLGQIEKSEISVSEETNKAFLAMMGQLQATRESKSNQITPDMEKQP